MMKSRAEGRTHDSAAAGIGRLPAGVVVAGLAAALLGTCLLMAVPMRAEGQPEVTAPAASSGSPSAAAPVTPPAAPWATPGPPASAVPFRARLQVNDIEVGLLAGVDSVAAHERVVAVEAGLRATQSDSTLRGVPFGVLHVDGRWLVVRGGTPVLDVTPADTAGGVDPRPLAEAWAARLNRAFLTGVGEELRHRLFWKVALGLALPLLYVFLLRLAGALFRRTYQALRRTTRLRQITRKGPFARLPADAAERSIARLVGLLRVIVVATLSFAFLLALLDVFPQTERLAKGIWRTARGLLSTAGIMLLGWVPRLVILIVLLVALRIGFRFSDFLTVSLSRRRGGGAQLRRDQARMVNVIVKALLVFGAVLVFTILLPPGEALVLTLLILAAVAFLLVTLHEPLSALGQHLVFGYTGICAPGDRVRVAGRQGVVLGIDAFGLRLLTRRGDLLFFPYRQVVSGLEVFPRGTWSWRWRMEIRGISGGAATPAGTGATPVHLAVRRALHEAWGRLDREALLHLVELRGGTRVYDLVLRSSRRRVIAFARAAWPDAPPPEEVTPGAGMAAIAAGAPADARADAPADAGADAKADAKADARAGPTADGSARPRGSASGGDAATFAGIDERSRRDNEETARCGEILEEALLAALGRNGLRVRLSVHD